MVGRLASAFEANDIDGIVALLADDVRLAMPPLPLEYVGREEARRFYAVVSARPGRRRLVETRPTASRRSRSTRRTSREASSSRPA